MPNRIHRPDRRTFTLGLAALGAAAALPAGASTRQRAPTLGPIVISGAAGHLGELTIRELLARGIPASRLILVSRTPERLQSYAGQGASVRFGDFTQPESLSAAFAGGRQMLLISIGFSKVPRPVAHKNAIDAAKRAGVEHIAYTSWIGLAGGDRSGLGADHYQTEETLKASGIAWTFLRNSIYMETRLPVAAQMIRTGRAEVSPADLHVAYVAREDCAASAAAVLAARGHDNRAYAITGPYRIDNRAVAETAAAVTGKAIRIERAAAPARPPRYGGSSIGIVSAAVAEITGRPAMSLKTFFEQHRAELLGERAATT